MKTETLLTFTAPAFSTETPVCAACKVWIPECLVPVGDGSKGMCWMCAHHVVDHLISVDRAGAAVCKCRKDQIFPRRVLEEREAMLEAARKSGSRTMLRVEG